MFRAHRLALVALAVGAGGCGPSAESVEAGRVVHAIDELRNAPSEPIEPRRKLLTLLEAQAAAGELSAKARDKCAKAYRLLIDGSALEASVRARMSDPKKVDPALLRDLSDAEAKVSESRSAMPDCDSAAADLRRRFR